MRRSGKTWARPALLAAAAVGLAGLGLFAMASAANAAQATPEDVAPIATSNGTAAPAEKVDPHAAPAQITWPALPADEEEQLGPPPLRKIHGMVEAGVGTGGYREVGGVVTVPIGQTGEATIAVQQTQGNLGRYRYRY